MWLVRTTYKAGVYISSGEIMDLERKCKISKTKYDTYDEAYQALKELEKNADYPIPEEYKPNHLYQLFSDRVYVVLYNSSWVGFFRSNTENEALSSSYYKKRFNLDYNAAVGFVTSLEAETGESEVVVSKVPVCGRWYPRKTLYQY